MKCKYCNADVSVAEKICPHCNHPVNEDNPETIAKKKKSRWLAVGIAAIAIIFIVTTVGMIMSSNSATTSAVNSAVNKNSAPAGKTIGITYTLLHERFNDNVNVKKQDILMKNVTNGDFSYNLDKSILLSGSVDPGSKEVTRLQVIAKPTNRDESIKMLTAIGVIVESLYPSDANRMRDTVLGEMGFKQGGDIRNANNSSVHDNFKFHFAAVPEVGYVFTVTNKDAAE